MVTFYNFFVTCRDNATVKDVAGMWLVPYYLTVLALCLRLLLQIILITFVSDLESTELELAETLMA